MIILHDLQGHPIYVRKDAVTLIEYSVKGPAQVWIGGVERWVKETPDEVHNLVR